MKISHHDSHAPVSLIQFAEALIAYAPSPKELDRICHAIWPACEIYKGHTHWRVMPEGQTMHHDDRSSIYVDFADCESNTRSTDYRYA